MKLITILAFTLLSFQLYAQSFDKTLPDSARLMSIAPTSDGGAIILGNNLYLIRGAQDKIIIMKVNALGEREWRSDFDISGIVNDYLFSPRVRIAQDSDGNYWLGLAQISGTSQYIMKLDKNGNRLFSKYLNVLGGAINIYGNQLMVFGIKDGIWQMSRYSTNGDSLATTQYPLIGQSVVWNAPFSCITVPNSKKTQKLTVFFRPNHQYTVR